MRKTKYIVGKLNSSNCTTAVVFDELINHSRKNNKLIGLRIYNIRYEYRK